MFLLRKKQTLVIMRVLKKKLCEDTKLGKKRCNVKLRRKGADAPLQKIDLGLATSLKSEAMMLHEQERRMQRRRSQQPLETILRLKQYSTICEELDNLLSCY